MEMITNADSLLKKMRAEASEELTGNILPYWVNRMPDMMQGGFYGRIDGRDRIIADAPRGAILNARIL